MQRKTTSFIEHGNGDSLQNLLTVSFQCRPPNAPRFQASAEAAAGAAGTLGVEGVAAAGAAAAAATGFACGTDARTTRVALRSGFSALLSGGASAGLADGAKAGVGTSAGATATGFAINSDDNGPAAAALERDGGAGLRRSATPPTMSASAAPATASFRLTGADFVLGWLRWLGGGASTPSAGLTEKAPLSWLSIEIARSVPTLDDEASARMRSACSCASRMAVRRADARAPNKPRKYSAT